MGAPAGHAQGVAASRASATDFAALPRERLKTMAAAGQEVLDCFRVLAKSNQNIVGELLRDVETFYEWDHYPKGDVYDHETHSQYYYHAHPAEERPGEHGHFHTFLRPDGMPAGLKPVALPDHTPPADANDALSHIVGVSMDKYGIPIRLFSTNRWVTGETWYSADDVCAMIDHFEIDLHRPCWAVNRWLTGMVRLFQPQIVALLHQRDARMAELRAARPDDNVFEDRDIEVMSQIDISVDAQIAAIGSALNG